MTLRRLLELPISEISYEDISNLILEEAEEGARLELKRELPAANQQRDPWMTGGNRIANPARDGLAKEIVALANAYGGVVVVGVDETEDHPKRARGPDPILIPRVSECSERLLQTLDTIIDPPLPIFESRGILNPDSDDGSGVLILRVGQSIRAPHGYGRPPAVYMRRGSRSEPVSMRDLQSLLFETRTRGERIIAVREARSQRLHNLLSALEAGRLRDEHGATDLQGHHVCLRCTAIPTDDLSINMSRAVQAYNFTRPSRHIVNPQAAPALGEGDFSDHWRPRAGGVEIIESRRSRYSRWYLGDSGLVEASGFAPTDVYRGNDNVVTPAWFAPVAAQVLAMIEQVRRYSGRTDVEYAIDVEVICDSDALRAVVGDSRFEEVSLVHDRVTSLGPFSVGSSENFQAVFSEIERSIWSVFGLRPSEAMTLNAEMLSR